jgi:hypothetical protein
MRTRNVMIGLVGVGIVAVVVWAVMVAVPTLTGDLAAEPSADGRLPALPTTVASDLQWESGAGTVGSWVTTAATFGSDGFIYALSTAPGLRQIPEGVPAPHAIYRSQDGFSWVVEPLTGLGEDLYARDIAHSGSNLYLVGTAPSAANPAAAVVRVGSSQDGGASWASVDLELANDAGGGRVGGGIQVDVAANPLGMMVSANRIIFGANGDVENDLTVFAGSGLDDLPVSPVPFGEGFSLERLEATPSRFYAVVRPNVGIEARSPLLELWRSVDGQDWEKLENIPFLDVVSAFGEVGGRRVVVGQLEGRVVLGASIDDVAWDEVDMSEILPTVVEGQWVSASGVGGAGLYFNVQSFLPTGPDSMQEVSQLIESPDLLSWSSTAAVTLLNGFVEQIVVGDDFVFVNATSGALGGRVHLIGTRG